MPMGKSNQEKIEKVIDSFSRTTEKVITLDELKERLCSGRKLTIKFGVDVTAPHLHIGHAVNLWMYRELQELGHKVVFMIGDFTTQIGDPTGKSETRPIVPEEEIEKNAEAFIKQAKTVLIDDSDLVEVRRNSEWYDEMSAAELLSLMSMVTHNRLTKREMFQKRIEEGNEIYESELVYPIFQGYDSKMLESDLTIIGSDQLYNEMLGRFYQEKFDQDPQVIITTKITPGINGGKKQSKSLGNYIGISHSPKEKFGRVMSIPDDLIVEYFKVYTKVPMETVREIEQNLESDPMKYKLLLAEKIVERYHGSEEAKKQREQFKKKFSKGEFPSDAPKISMGTKEAEAFDIVRECYDSNFRSNTEIKHLIEQGAVKVGKKTIEDWGEMIEIPSEGLRLKVGKRDWFEIFPDSQSAEADNQPTKN